MLWSEMMSDIPGSKDINRGRYTGHRIETAGRTPQIVQGIAPIPGGSAALLVSCGPDSEEMEWPGVPQA